MSLPPKPPRRAVMLHWLWLILGAAVIIYCAALIRPLVVPDVSGSVDALRLIQDALWGVGFAVFVAGAAVARGAITPGLKVPRPAGAGASGASALSTPLSAYRLGLAAVLFLVVGLNIAVDPYNVYGTNRFPPRLRNHLQPKLQAYVQQVLRGAPPDLLLAGSSRLIRFRPDYLAEQLHAEVFNLAMEGVTAKDLLPLLNFVAAQPGGAPPVIMLEVADDGTFLGEPTLLYAPSAMLPQMALPLQLNYVGKRLEAGLSAAALSDSLYTLWYTTRIGPPAPPLPVLANGGMNVEERYGEAEFAARMQVSISQGQSDTQRRASYAASGGESCAPIMASLFAELDPIVAWASQQRTSLILLVTPHHPVYARAVDDRDPVLASCRRLLDQYMGQHPQVFYLPFRTLESMQGVATNVGFLDGTHLTAFNSERLLDSAMGTIRLAVAAAASTRGQPIPNRTRPLPRAVRLRFDGSAHTRGWYLPEGSPVLLQWLGPEPSGEVEVRIDTRTALELSFCVQTAITMQVLSTLRLSVNGVAVPLMASSGADCPFLYRAVLPRPVLSHQDGSVTLTFHVARTISPLELNPLHADVRRLGVAVSWLALEPLQTRIMFDGSWKTANLYPPERNEKGQPFQWLGPLPLTRFEIPAAEAAPLRVTLCGQAAITPEVLASLRLIANDHPLELHPATPPDCAFAYQAIIPVAVLAHQADQVTLDLAVEQTIVPASINASNPDPRQLGIALRWMLVEPE